MSKACVSVTLDREELMALMCMSKSDCRHPREQIRFLVREAALVRGFLTSREQQKEQQHDQPE